MGGKPTVDDMLAKKDNSVASVSRDLNRADSEGKVSGPASGIANAGPAFPDRPTDGSSVDRLALQKQILGAALPSVPRSNSFLLDDCGWPTIVTAIIF